MDGVFRIQATSFGIMELVTVHRSISAIRWDDPCVRAFALAEGGGKQDLEQRLRTARAKAAREIGWAPQDSTDEEALRSLHGRTGRGRLLDRAVYIHRVDWRAATAADEEILAGAAWVTHLRAHGIITLDAFARHIEKDLGIKSVKPVKVLRRVERAVRELGPLLARKSRRSDRSWGREAIRLLRRVRMDTVKRGALRGRTTRRVYLVKVDGTELDLLREAWTLRQDLMGRGRTYWRQVQKDARDRGLTTDEYLREMVKDPVD